MPTQARRLFAVVLALATLAGCGSGIDDQPAKGIRAEAARGELQLQAAAPFHKDLSRYRAIADNLIGYSPGLDVLVRNHRITSAYAQLFATDPQKFPWFGAAMHASWSVGVAIFTLGCAADNNCPPSAPGSAADLIIRGLKSIGRDRLLHMRAQLALGNINVFHSVYPAFLAFQEGGIEEMNYLQQSGQLDYDHAGNIINAVWEVHYNKNPRGAVENLLELEQRHVLVPVFTPDLQALSPVTYLFFKDNPLDGDFEWFFAQKYNGHFGNIANTEDRWLWVVDRVIPHYMGQFNHHLGDLLSWTRSHGGSIGSIHCGCYAGNGDYCGAVAVDSGGHGHPDNCVLPFEVAQADLYTCANGSWKLARTCAEGCSYNPAGPDVCGSLPPCGCYDGNGIYCGSVALDHARRRGCSLPAGLSSGNLYRCVRGTWSLDERCPNGRCAFNPRGPDYCSDSCAGRLCGSGNHCCPATSWCGSGGQCCSRCGPGCPC